MTDYDKYFLDYIKRETIDKHEKGFQKHKSDPGNYTKDGTLVGTKYGISGAFLERYRGKKVSEKDVKSLKKSEAAKILFDEFYKKPGYDKLPAGIDELMFDYSMHSGAGRAKKEVLKRAESIEDASPEQILEARREHVRRIGSKNFQRGWLKRIDTLEDEMPKPEKPVLNEKDFLEHINTRMKNKRFVPEVN